MVSDGEIEPHHLRAACKVDIGGWSNRQYIALVEALCQFPDSVYAKNYVGVDIDPGKAARNLVAHVEGIGFARYFGF